MIISTLIIINLVIFMISIWRSSGNTEPPITDQQGDPVENSITFIKDTVFNGASQRLTVRGYDKDNPVLLKVHGGPASYFIHPWVRSKELEKRFIVCYWDQRGSGPAYNNDIPDESLTLHQIVEDGIAVSKYLKKTFSKRKIFIHGHSWGTAVSTFMVKEAPDLFYSYIGIGQMADQLKSEKLSFEFVMKEAIERSDTTAIEKLNEIGPPPYSSDRAMINAVKIVRKYINKYNPAKIEEPDFKKMIKELLFYQGLGVGDKFKILQQKKYNDKAFETLWPTCARVNLTRDVKELDIPVFIIQGKKDHHTQTSLAREYFDSLRAPLKKWYLFENSTHRPDMEEPKKYIAVIDSILELSFDNKK